MCNKSCVYLRIGCNKSDTNHQIINNMKKLLLLILIVPSLCFSQDKIKIFKTQITSLDVNGDNTFGPKNDQGISPLMKDPKIESNTNDKIIEDYLGRYVIKDMRSPSALLNMATSKKYYTLLDDINFAYYEEIVIPNVLNRDASFSQNESYKKFKTELNKLTTTDAKKQLLFQEEYQEVRDRLEASRFKPYIPIDVVQKQIISTAVKDTIKANISAALIKNKLDVKTGLLVELDKLIDRTITIGGQYIEAYYNDTYIDYIERRLKVFVKNPTSNTDDFNLALTSFLDSKKNTIITGLSVIKIKIDYAATKVINDSIAAFLKGNFNITNDQLATASTDIFHSYDVNKNFTGTATLNHYFFLKYSYNSRLRKKNLSR